VTGTVSRKLLHANPGACVPAIGRYFDKFGDSGQHAECVVPSVETGVLFGTWRETLPRTFLASTRHQGEQYELIGIAAPVLVMRPFKSALPTDRIEYRAGAAYKVLSCAGAF
jgi:hypothetical protein